MAGTKKTKTQTATAVSLSVLTELGLRTDKGEWCFASKPILERMEEWHGQVPQFVRALDCIMLHTLGYLPGAGGVAAKDGKAVKDPQRFGPCKLHGALLAVTQIAGKGRLVPIGPNHVRNELNEAAARAFEAQEGRPPTPEEQEYLYLTAQDVRDAFAELEGLGVCLRTDNEDIPFPELRKTEEGRKKLSTLSGDNKIRIYLYLRPKVSAAQGIVLPIPSNTKSDYLKHLYKRFLALKLDKDVLDRLKPLYRTVVIDLGLDIEPEAFVGDTDLQETVGLEIESRDAYLSNHENQLRAAILVRYPSAAPQSPAASNPNDSGVIGPDQPGREAAEPHSAVRNPNSQARLSPETPPKPLPAPDSRTAEDKGRKAGSVEPRLHPASPTAPPALPDELVSQPRKKQDALSGAEVANLLDVMAEYVPANERAARQLLTVCREVKPSCTITSIFDAVKIFGPKASGKPSPVGYLQACVVDSLTKERKPATQAESFDERKLRRTREQAAAREVSNG